MTSMPAHRRTILTDRIDLPYDVQNDARCNTFGDRRTCHNNACPRHDAPGYSEMMARHATDSIGPIPTPDLIRAERYHSSNQVGR